MSDVLLCAHCGLPAPSAIWIGDFAYHIECTRGPGGPTYYEPVPPPALTEQRVREIAREEASRILERLP